MITKENWDGLTEAQRTERLTSILSDLCAIDDGTHPLSGKPEQGGLSKVRKELETQVLQFVEWENTRHEKNRPSPQ